MYSLILLTALVPAADPAVGGSPPEQGVAVIDAKGNLRLTHASNPCTYGPATPEEMTLPVKRGDQTTTVKMKIRSVMLTTIELPASAVDGFTVDGKKIAAEKLATLLDKERTVLIAMDGKKVDPFLLELYKEGTIVLVPPSGLMNRGYSGGAYGEPIPVPAPPPPQFDRKLPREEIKRPDPDRRMPERGEVPPVPIPKLPRKD